MKEANYIEIAEKLYYIANPTTKMDVPSYAYELTQKWHKEWQESDTDLEFFDYCILHKHAK